MSGLSIMTINIYSLVKKKILFLHIQIKIWLWITHKVLVIRKEKVDKNYQIPFGITWIRILADVFNILRNVAKCHVAWK